MSDFEIELISSNVPPLYRSNTDVFLMGMRSGKTHLINRVMKGRAIQAAYRQELNNVMTQK